MIIVTGTKRSGTSMWMQILKAAGIQVLGQAFPKDWGETIREANPEGFYESPLRDGINFMTNPDRRTGAYLHPADSREMAVKVFIPGLARSDLAFVDCVLATMRSPRAYHRSLEKMYRMEHENRQALRNVELPAPRYVTPALEWWMENHQLLVDCFTRGYPMRVVPYEHVMQQPEKTIREALAFVELGDPEAALQAVRPELKHHDPGELPPPPDIDEKHVAVFDALYERMCTTGVIDPPFVEMLNKTHEELLPRIEQEVREVRRHRTQLRQAAMRAEAERRKAAGATPEVAAGATSTEPTT